METADQAFQSLFAGIPRELHLLTGTHKIFFIKYNWDHSSNL